MIPRHNLEYLTPHPHPHPQPHPRPQSYLEDRVVPHGGLTSLVVVEDLVLAGEVVIGGILATHNLWQKRK